MLNYVFDIELFVTDDKKEYHEVNQKCESNVRGNERHSTIYLLYTLRVVAFSLILFINPKINDEMILAHVVAICRDVFHNDRSRSKVLGNDIKS